MRTSNSSFGNGSSIIHEIESRMSTHAESSNKTTMKVPCGFLLIGLANAFVVQPPTSRVNVACNSFSSSGVWTAGLGFGKGPFRFYYGFDQWMKPFTAEDRDAFPELFTLPKGVYEVSLTSPLGIVFEEIEVGRGVYVQDLVEGGAAEKQGIIQKGDILVGVTAVKIIGAKWERRLIPARPFDFYTAVNAIMSNEKKWGCDDVIVMFERPDEADPEKTDAFLDFFEPPSDSPWRQQQ